MKKQLQVISNSIYTRTPFIDRTAVASHTYSASSLVLQFFIFSFIGWLWEVLLHVYIDHAFINRGVMTGPWLPIYGSGGILMLLLLKRLAENPKKLFLSIMVLCGVIEYVTGTFLEYVFHAKWWDYSDMLFNIQGRVCLAGLLLFAVGGCLIIYVGAPWLDRKLSTMPAYVRRGLCIVLVLIFVGDAIFSVLQPNTGAGITFPH